MQTLHPLYLRTSQETKFNMKFIERLRSLRRSKTKVSRKPCTIMVDEKDLKPVTTKFSSSASTVKTPTTITTSIGSSSGSSQNKTDIIDFTISIEALDGIIATNTGGRHANSGKLGVPVFGVVAYHQKIEGSKNIVKSNIPSMPLVKSNSSFGNRDRFHAEFGFPQEDRGSRHGQINIALPMHRNNYSLSGYTERQFDLSFSLMRGSEVIKMGVVSTILAGDECGDSKLAQIGQEKMIRTTRMKGNKRISNKSKTTVGARSASFIQDPSRRYSLQRANLRVTVEANHRASKKSATSAFVLGPTQSTEKEVAPITELISIVQSDSISVITGMDTKLSSSSTSSSSAEGESFVYKNSLLSMSLSEDTTAVRDRGAYYNSGSEENSLVESDFETVNTVTETQSMNAQNIGFSGQGKSKSLDDSTLESGCTSGDYSTLSNLLDGISLGSFRRQCQL
eukprot:scaffold3337_cov256-Chaetoceros_neogracile.AAC.10